MKAKTKEKYQSIIRDYTIIKYRMEEDVVYEYLSEKYFLSTRTVRMIVGAYLMDREVSAVC